MQAVDPALGTLTQSSSTGNVYPIMFIPTKWWLSLGYTYCYVYMKVIGGTYPSHHSSSDWGHQCT